MNGGRLRRQAAQATSSLGKPVGPALGQQRLPVMDFRDSGLLESRGLWAGRRRPSGSSPADLATRADPLPGPGCTFGPLRALQWIDFGRRAAAKKLQPEGDNEPVRQPLACNRSKG